MSEKEQKNTSRKSSNVKSIRTHTVDKKDTSQRKSVVKSKKDLKKANANTISKVSSASSDAVKNALGQVSRTALRQNDVTQDAVEMYYKFKNNKRASKYTLKLLKKTGRGGKYVGKSTAKTISKGARFTKKSVTILRKSKATATATRSMQLALHRSMQIARQSAVLWIRIHHGAVSCN